MRNSFKLFVLGDTETKISISLSLFLFTLLIWHTHFWFPHFNTWLSWIGLQQFAACIHLDRFRSGSRITWIRQTARIRHVEQSKCSYNTILFMVHFEMYSLTGRLVVGIVIDFFFFYYKSGCLVSLLLLNSLLWLYMLSEDVNHK